MIDVDLRIWDMSTGYILSPYHSVCTLPYSTLLIANGENVKVVQELMRHASTRFTIEVYTQARTDAKRQAQQRLVQTILSEENDVAPEIQGRSDVTMT